jgi:hypothetical protein
MIKRTVLSVQSKKKRSWHDAYARSEELEYNSLKYYGSYKKLEMCAKLVTRISVVFHTKKISPAI